MKKTGFVIVLALAALAWVSAPAPAVALCTAPACLVSPGCCIDRQCASWCESKGGGVPHCGGNGSGGCCWCEQIQ